MSSWRESVGLSKEQLDQLSKEDLQLQEAIHEFISTEENYFKDLNNIVSNFKNPLENTGVLSKHQIQYLFANIEKLNLIHDPFLRALKQRSAETKPIAKGISKVIVSYLSTFACPYRAFCSLQKTSLETYHTLIKENPEFDKFLKEVYISVPECRLGLPSLLLKPVQRVTRYPLLLQAILKYLNESSPEYASYMEALRVSQELVEESNEHTHKLENVERLFEVKSLLDFSSFPTFRDAVYECRKIIKEGTIRVTHGNKQQDLYTFVFDRVIVFTKPIVRKKKTWYKVKHKPLVMSSNDFNAFESEGFENRFELIQTSPGEELIPPFYFKAKDLMMKDEWLKAIQESLTTSTENDGLASKATLRTRLSRGNTKLTFSSNEWTEDGLDNSDDEIKEVPLVRRSTGDLHPSSHSTELRIAESCSSLDGSKDTINGSKEHFCFLSSASSDLNTVAKEGLRKGSSEGDSRIHHSPVNISSLSSSQQTLSSKKSLTEEVLDMLNYSIKTSSTGSVNKPICDRKVPNASELGDSSLIQLVQHEPSQVLNPPETSDEFMDDIDRAIGEAVLGPENNIEDVPLSVAENEFSGDNLSVGELLVEETESFDIYTRKRVPNEFKKTKRLNRGSMGSLKDFVKEGEDLTLDNIKCFLDKYVREYELDAGLPNVMAFLETKSMVNENNRKDMYGAEIVEFLSKFDTSQPDLNVDESAVIMAFCALKKSITSFENEEDISNKLYEMEFITYLHAICCLERRHASTKDVNVRTGSYSKKKEGEIENIQQVEELKRKLKEMNAKCKKLEQLKKEPFSTSIHPSKQSNDKEIKRLNELVQNKEKKLKKMTIELSQEQAHFTELEKRFDNVKDKRERDKKKLKEEMFACSSAKEEIAKIKVKLKSTCESLRDEKKTSRAQQMELEKELKQLREEIVSFKAKEKTMKDEFDLAYASMKEEKVSREEEISRLDLLIEELNEELSKSDYQRNIVKEKCSQYLSLLNQLNSKGNTIEQENIELRLQNGELTNKLSLVESRDKEVIDDVSHGLISSQRHNCLLEEATKLLQDKLELQRLEISQLKVANESLRGNLISVQEINNRIVQWSGCVFYEDQMKSIATKQ
eukprot:Nk52_evm27s265 gene=Nk52_evmTU27s265